MGGDGHPTPHVTRINQVQLAPKINQARLQMNGVHGPCICHGCNFEACCAVRLGSSKISQARPWLRLDRRHAAGHMRHAATALSPPRSSAGQDRARAQCTVYRLLHVFCEDSQKIESRDTGKCLTEVLHLSWDDLQLADAPPRRRLRLLPHVLT